MFPLHLFKKIRLEGYNIYRQHLAYHHIDSDNDYIACTNQHTAVICDLKMTNTIENFKKN